MRFKKRLVAVISFLCFLFSFYIRFRNSFSNKKGVNLEISLKSYYNVDDDEKYDRKIDVVDRKQTKQKFNNQNCRMETCFNFNKCRHNFRVYLYPILKNGGLDDAPEDLDDNKKKVSHFLYNKFLKVLNESSYLTNDPKIACLFVLSIDTLDRDPLSQDYVTQIDKRISKLPYWNHGENHVIFNLYSGTWPNYDENDLRFDYGRAILARASMSVQSYRRAFDISIPLFHKNHPGSVLEPTGTLNSNQFPIDSTYFVSFKGKRYVYGIGSKTRNTLYHLHNRNDSIILTTCRHGKNWKEMSDDRCNLDDAEYDKYDYQSLLENSKFCLIPRGRRLGSFRFLEALKSACIPVILSNTWILPFSEVIDWSQAVIWADERLLLQTTNVLRDISDEQIFQMKQHSQFLWDQYFSSIEKIIQTTFEIIRDRIPNQIFIRSHLQWNQPPGALYLYPGYSNNLADYPFYFKQIESKFTAIINIKSRLNSLLMKLIKNLILSQYLAMIVILWTFDESPQFDWNRMLKASNITVKIVRGTKLTHFNFIKTSAILQLDDAISLTTDEINFAFHVWTQNTDRIIGYNSRSHYWNDVQRKWCYLSKMSNDYSMILLSFAFYHRFYNFLYSTWLVPLLDRSNIKNPLMSNPICYDIAMNFLVSHITKQSPIKLVETKSSSSNFLMPITSQFQQRQICMQLFVDVFGYMPLLKSSVRFDPVFFKDDVSNFRKKYKQFELIRSKTPSLFSNNF